MHLHDCACAIPAVPERPGHFSAIASLITIRRGGGGVGWMGGPLWPPTVLVLCFLFSLLTACSAAANGQPIIKNTTPTPATAAGEPVLPHSQIYFHDAPLPTRAA